MRNKLVIAGLSVAAAFVIACGAGSKDDAGGGGGNSGGGNPPPAAAPGLNTPVRDGKFEFVVSSVKCGQTKLGTGPLAQTAQGQFCAVALSVKNIGKEAQLFAGSNQKAFDAKGTEFSNSTEAELVANEKADTFLKEINPGNQVKGTIVFDVPKGTKLTKLELHDSAFSGGVNVALP